MSLSLYNSLSKRKEVFVPLEPRRVRMYTCGPTVYSHPHIGNFRAFIAADILRRYLEYLGYEVIQVVNITDVGHMTTDDQAISSESGEDKIQAAAQREKKPPTQIARFYEENFLHLVKLLNLKPAYAYPRATEHIKEMIEIIRKLLETGYAYKVNGNIYYEVAKFKGYGHLSGNVPENLLAGARIEVNPEKKSPLDFALWKQDPKHIMQWDSPWGKGFPGWHIECSVMSMKYLGSTLDIHSGGEDNIFPHHESEIAQSEAATGKPFVNYWFHVRHLLVDNQKMSKSQGNFYTVRDILDKGFHPLVLRYALLNTHYRQPLNFTLEGLEAARQSLQRFLDFKQYLVERISRALKGPPNAFKEPYPDQIEQTDSVLSKTKEWFELSLNDDLNISEALGAIFEMVRTLNRIELSPAEAGKTLRLLEQFDTVLGVLAEEQISLSEEVERLIKDREMARQSKDYQKSDQIRTQLNRMGIILEDTPQGVRWKRKL